MLKANSKAVLDIIATQKKRNASKAYKEVHPDATNASAIALASALMAKPEAQIYLQQHVNKAKARIVELVDSEKEDIALRASESILNRELGTPTQRIAQTTSGITLTIDLTSALNQ